MTLFIDIETFSSNSLLTGGVYKYVEAPDFEILLFAYSIDHGPVVIVDLMSMETLPVEILNALMNPDIKKKAWNAAFEITCINKYFDIRMPIESWECTMVKSALYGYPLSLEKAAEVLKVENKKDKIGNALIRYFSVPQKKKNRFYPEDSPEKWEQFKQYCIGDVKTENDIARKLENFPFPIREKLIWDLDQRINARGISADKYFILYAIKHDTTYRERSIKRAVELTGLANPNSAIQLKKWLTQEMEEPIETLRKDDIPAMIEGTTSYAAAQVLRLRQLLSKSSITKYKRMLEMMNADGRIRGLFQYYGAGTGRWAGRGVQPHNLTKNYLKDLALARELVAHDDLEGLEMMFGNVPNTLSELIRTALVPSKGMKLIIGDFSAIEARVIAWIAKEKWRMDVFNTHGLIYEASGAAMFRVPIEQVGKGTILREKAKISELALGYQGGVKALLKMGAIKMGLNEDELQELVDRWRNANRHIVQLWHSVGYAALCAVRDSTRTSTHGIDFFVRRGILFIKLHSGRLLSYPAPQMVINKYENLSLAYEGMITQGKWGRIELYGGKIVENIVQAEARDLLAAAMIRMESKGFPIVLHVHDELVTEVPIETDYLETVEEIMNVTPDWAKGLPIRADVFENSFYKKDG